MFDHVQNNEISVGTIYIEDMEAGMARSVTKHISDTEIQMFAELSTDRNPVHMCDTYAKDSIFGGRVAHGMLTAGLFSAIIGEQLPGHGAIYLSQSLSFLAPVRPGDEVTATVSVREINREKRRVTLDCIAYVGEKAVLKGEALVLAPSRNI